MKFKDLIKNILAVHGRLSQKAAKSVDMMLTARNWFIGFYIEKYERHGQDRARYGEKLMDQISKELTAGGMDRCDRRELYRYRNFFLTYPRFVETLSPLSDVPKLPGRPGSIVETVSPQLAKGKSLSAPSLPAQKLLQSLSFSHFAELIEIRDSLKRAFYELEAVKGNWSVRELKRQIGTLYFERSSLSKNKKKLSRLVQSKTESITPAQIIRDPYVFEFLGMKPKEVPGESHLEDALLDKLQDFLLELGKGFCFESRQKRIVMGGEYYFVDLVFYHRILKCHVLLELKADHFKHEHLGQLNTYVSWFKKNEMNPGDNPPLGILLCTDDVRMIAERTA
ncbi:MAG: PDDEXK nuclease domain-containing protein [Elusimicrobia bacterium]|nr:PDDEXK nuclease domain-containing protein [Candidatus Obscuribacterium magneticum]